MKNTNRIKTALKKRAALEKRIATLIRRLAEEDSHAAFLRDKLARVQTDYEELLKRYFNQGNPNDATTDSIDDNMHTV